MRNDINTFTQIAGESLYEAWERFKELMRICPHHGLPLWMQVQIFYNGINPNFRSTIDAAAGGSINNKSPEESFQLMEEMASNNIYWPSERYQPKRANGTRETEDMTRLEAQMARLANIVESQMGNISKIQSVTCDFCQGNHDSLDCQVGNTFAPSNTNANYVSNYGRPQQFSNNNNPYSNTYNPGWRNHPNLQWGNQNQQKAPQFEKQPSTLEDKLNQIMQENQRQHQETQRQLQEIVKSNDARFNHQEAAVRNLEKQVGQMSQQLSERPRGSLPSNTEKNPMESARAIELRSGKTLEEPIAMNHDQGQGENQKEMT